MKLIRLLAPVCALLIPCALHAEAFEGKVSMKMTSSDQKNPVSNVDFSLKDGFMRTDVNTSRGTASMIWDYKARQMTILMPQQRMYMVRDLPQPGQAPAGAAAGGKAGVSGPSLTDTGVKDTILGYSCEKYTATGKEGTSDIWVTDQLGTFGGLPTGGPGRPQAPKAWESALSGKGFFPLRVITRSSRGESFRMEVTSIDKASLPDTAFQPPDGWRKFDIGAMMGGLGLPGSH
ncbi:MAG TPA: DUF4412 domain-containing protein [Opitutaceae bacterium]|jgi:hypothetical protein